MLLETFVTLQKNQVAFYIVINLRIIQQLQVKTRQMFDVLYFFDIALPYIGSQIEVERRNGLPAVHLVLYGFHRDTGHDGSRLYTLGGTAFTVSGLESMFKNLVQRMLDAGERFGGIIILVMDVQVVVTHCPQRFFRKQIVVHERFGRFRCELHHHAGRRIGIHVGILTGHVVRFRFHYFKKHFTCLCLAGNAALVTIGDVALCHFLSRRSHQFHFHHVLNLFYGRLFLAPEFNAVDNLINEDFILAGVCRQHCLADGGGNLLAVKAHDATISLDYCLYHMR